MKPKIKNIAITNSNIIANTLASQVMELGLPLYLVMIVGNSMPHTKIRVII
jgi:hypothetical protein